MTLANTQQEPEEYSTEMARHLRQSPYLKTVQQFTVRKWWRTPIDSLGLLAFGLTWLICIMASLALFPWDDSTMVQRLAIELIFFPYSLVAIWIFILSAITWTDPYRLKLDGNGGLILRSVVRDRRIAIKDIKTVVLVKRENDERGDDALGIRIKFSDGKLNLCHFSEREEFLKALEAAHPAIVIESL